MRIFKSPKKYEKAIMDESIKLDIKKSWYLYGKAGSGKTYFSWAMYWKRAAHLKELEEAKRIWRPSIIIHNFSLLLGEVRGYQIEKRFWEENQIIETELLILDDLGSELRTDYSDDFLFRIMNYRYEEEMWTGITSNMKVGELPYEDRIKSRIIGIVEDNKFHLESKDRRIIEN